MKIEILKPSRPLVFQGSIVETDEECAKLLIRLGNAKLVEEKKEEPKAEEPVKKATKKKAKKVEE